MRLTVCLEGNAEGRVLASVDMEEIVKMTMTDDIMKSNFNPQMFKTCIDTANQCGYEQGKVDAIEEFANWLPKHFDLRFSNNPEVWIDEYFNHTSEKIFEQLKEKK